MFDESKSLTESELLDISTKSEFCIQDEAQKQEIKDRTEFLRIEYDRYKINRILLDAIRDCVEEEDGIDERLRQKVKNIIFGAEAAQVSLGSKSSGDSFQLLLGVVPAPTQLTYPESSRLQVYVKDKLDERYRKLPNSLHADSSQNKSPFDLDPLDTVLLEYKNKLISEQNMCLRNQEELAQTLEDLKTIRLKFVPEIANKKVEECTLISRINYLKSQLAEQKCRIDIFMETSNSFKAYTEAIKDLKEQQEEYKFEIDGLIELKQKYAQVSCKEYADILKSYVQYKTALEKRKLMYKMFS